MSAIPLLTRSHVEEAIAQIDREGIPPRRGATKFQLVVDGRYYPPKYVVSLAAYYATGRELRPDEFSGGEETNSVLRLLGFVIVGPGLPTPNSATYTKPSTPPPGLAGHALKALLPRAKSNEGPPIVRVVVQGAPASTPRAAGDMLLEAFSNWPVSGRARFTITPGGFVVGEFPSRWSGGLSWNSSLDDLALLVHVAKPLVDACVTKNVLAAAKARTSVLTVGVDLKSDTYQAELVAVIDSETGKIVRWTGKSYPTIDQEAVLVQVVDINSHLLEIADEKVLILGCHDLNMFSARARANQSPYGIRRQRCDAMAKATACFKPTIVLQHPHSTDTPNIWRIAWSSLVRDYPTVRFFASGIAYFRWRGRLRRSLHAVLEGTRSETGVVDVVVKSR